MIIGILLLRLWFVSSAKCNIPKLPISEIYDREVLPDHPCIFLTNNNRQNNLSIMSARTFLLDNYGQEIVKLSSSNSYSHGQFMTSLEDYIKNSVDLSSQFANETFYLFGNNYQGIWSEMLDAYINPPCRYCNVAGAKTLGIGGHASGVSFHLHGPGFSEVIIGEKQWFLFPPHVTSIVTSYFNPNMTVSRWVEEVYPLLSSNNTMDNRQYKYFTTTSLFTNPNSERIIDSSGNYLFKKDNIRSISTGKPDSLQDAINLLSANLYECSIIPGEILYFPSLWMHATLNIQSYNVFVSLFLDMQLIKQQNL